MHPFAYHRPSSLREALDLLGNDDGAELLAGGMTLLPTMKMRLAMPSAVIDLAAIESLRGITREKAAVVIGAMTTHADVAADRSVRESISCLAGLAGEIGDPQVRNRGTLGGSVANSDPAADYPAAVLALNATVITDRREIAADEFFRDMFETALEADEIITAVRFPQPRRAAYARFPNPASRYAVVGVMIADTADGYRVAVTGAAGCAYRERDIEAALSKSPDTAAIENLHFEAARFNDDMHATQEYRAALLKVLAVRAFAALAE